MKLLRQILAVPVKMVLQICAFFPKVDKFGLVGLIWKIGREPDYAGTYIFLTSQKKGIESAIETGEEIFKEYPSDRVAGMMGILEYDHYNLNKAKEWLERGRQCPEANPESLLWLELALAGNLDEINTDEVLNKILSRRDLSMNFTKRALVSQAEMFLREKKWDQADAILERILRIENEPGARWMKWTVAKAKGNETEAQKQLRLARTKKQKEIPNIHMALGWYYLGDIGKTQEYLAKAQQDGMTKNRITQINRELATFLESDNLCQQRGEAN
jgi:tetratricopeptide (TPR) repeat protein